MEQNVGKLDKAIRVIIAAILIVVSVGYLQGGWQIAGIVIGFLTFFTALVGWCLPYQLFGISTAGKKAAAKKVTPKVAVKKAVKKKKRK